MHYNMAFVIRCIEVNLWHWHLQINSFSVRSCDTYTAQENLIVKYKINDIVQTQSVGGQTAKFKDCQYF